MKIKIIGTCLILSLISFGVQSQIIIDSSLTRVMLKSSSKSNEDMDRSTLFGVFVFTNKNGKIEDIKFSRSKESSNLSDFVDTLGITNYYKKNANAFEKYPNSFILLPVIICNADAKQIKNISELFYNFSNLYSPDDNPKNKNLVISQPISVVYSESH